jgi:predicted Zn-dependent protease
MLNRWIRKLAPLSATLGFAAVIAGCAVNPATGDRELNFVSESQEVQMGREADKSILAQYGVYEDVTLEQYVERVGKKLAAVSERPGLEWHFRLLDSPVVNAFALPGGYIYITRGIMAAMNSEAQLAGVLGHEIGHVTARHTAQQITRSQLAGVGLLAGMILSSDVARYGDVLQQGVGLMFLKFGRDDENEADELGIRYAVKAGYDPRPIPDTYDMLARLSQRTGGGGLPTWLSTHPDPGDRKSRTNTLAHEAVLLRGESGLVINEDPFKKSLEGLVYGDDPRHGYLVDNHFYHPELNIQMDWPNGWKVDNSAAAVTGQSADGKAAIQLTIAKTGEGPSDPAAYVAYLRQKNEITQAEGRTGTINGASAWIGQIAVQGQGGSQIMALAFIQKSAGELYQFLGVPGENMAAGRFVNTVESFGPLRDASKAQVRPDRIVVVTSPGGKPFEAIVSAQPNVAKPADELAWLNNYFPKDVIPSGELLKIVRRGGNGA